MAADVIILRGMVFYGYHGVHPEEQRLGQRFLVDLEARCDLRPAGTSDEPAQTVNYSDLYRVAREIVEGRPRQLVETLAEEIAAGVLARFPLVESVTVTVWKPGAPIAGSVLERVGVQITRERGRAS
ncbi:dihydroneopterin aldolase [Thermomicrobiaceae bacterium CFH 74404]|uniref:7,8-dihydroneopterin aldolase n=1 Tax=Thermalbibacter longus TaxID=2951981 RepID=A0AA42BAU1_9BACT|nr:dihydroneopterin aldolase [Thermalbibacter longus]MCM8750122.1 dihydroneopterin aldolase [Thermalbibacter longus]